jgi:glycosyltransferase involved in cell wall biosynthesis
MPAVAYSVNRLINPKVNSGGTMAELPENGSLTYSVVIPVYNSQNTIRSVCEALEALFRERQARYEIVLVDDGSKDQSWPELKTIRAANEQVKIIRLAKNFGQQNALLCGFAHARGDFVITMDDDLQHPPQELPKLMAAMEPDVDVVIGALAQKQDSHVKKLGSRMVRYLNRKIFGIPPEMKLSSFRILRGPIVRQMTRINTPYPYIAGMIFSLTDRVTNAIVDHQPRAYGRSNYSFRKLISLAFNLVINYSSIPLRLLCFFGMMVSLAAFLIGAFFLVKKLVVGSAIQGWTSMIVLLSFFNGILLAVLSVMGEYLVRILGEISNRPSFMIREKHL